MQVSILMVRVLLATVDRAGVDRARFLEAAGIDARLIDEGTVRLSLGDYVRALQAAVDVSGNPAFGLFLGQQARPVMFDVVGPIAEQAGSLRESIEAMQRYARLIAEGHEPELREDGDTATIRFATLQGDHPAMRATAEFVMTGLASTLPLFAGGQAQPLGVRFAYPRPTYAAEYEAVLGPTVRFDCAFTEMAVPRAWLDKPHRKPRTRSGFGLPPPFIVPSNAGLD